MMAQTAVPVKDGDRYRFFFERTPLCQFLISFLTRLQRLPSTEQRSKVLEGFTATQVLRDLQASKVQFSVTLLFAACERGARTQHHIYRLISDEERADAAAKDMLP